MRVYTNCNRSYFFYLTDNGYGSNTVHFTFLQTIHL
jgi:hypothetical protein